jgi:hypothetical protein
MEPTSRLNCSRSSVASRRSDWLLVAPTCSARGPNQRQAEHEGDGADDGPDRLAGHERATDQADPLTDPQQTDEGEDPPNHHEHGHDPTLGRVRVICGVGVLVVLGGGVGVGAWGSGCR